MKMMKKYLYSLVFIFACTNVQAQDILPDAMPQKALGDHHGRPTTEQQLCGPDVVDDPEPLFEEPESLDLNIENLKKMLDKYDIKCKKIVLAQALLETGYFTSNVCMQSHNLFGLRRPSDGSYFTFDRWEESVRAYRDDVQYKYTGGNYYAFLNNIHYAEDRAYTSKVMKIAKTL